MSNGAVIDVGKAMAALGQGLTPPANARHKQFNAGVGPRGAKVETPIDEYEWEEVIKISRITHKSDDDETWGMTSFVMIGGKIVDDPMYPSEHKNRWISTFEGAKRLSVKPYEFDSDELKILSKDEGNPYQWAVMKLREGNDVLKFMGGLLRATGNKDLLIGKKTFNGFTDSILKLIESDRLIGETVRAEVRSTLNRQTGAREEFIINFSAV